MVGDCESVIETADRALALNPNSAFAWHARGVVHTIAGLPEEAVRSYERAIRMSPVDPGQHLQFSALGIALIELRRFDEAVVAARCPSSAPLPASLPLSSIRFCPSRT